MTDLITVCVKFFFVSNLLQYHYFDLLWCKLLLYCFTQIKGCCWLVHHGMKCAAVLMSNSSSKGLLTETRLPVGGPDRWLGSSIDAGADKREWYESISMIWLILPIHQLWIAQKWYRKQPLIDVFFFLLLLFLLFIMPCMYFGCRKQFWHVTWMAGVQFILTI